MAADSGNSDTSFSDLINREHEPIDDASGEAVDRDLQSGDNVGAASAKSPDPLSRDNSENATDDKEGNLTGAGDLLTRDNTSDFTDKKEDNDVVGGDPLRGETHDDAGSGDNTDNTESADTKTDTQEDEWEDILGNSLLKKKVIYPCHAE